MVELLDSRATGVNRYPRCPQPGNPSELADLARQRNLVVSDSRSAVEHAPAESLEYAQSHSISAGSDPEIAPDTGISRSFWVLVGDARRRPRV